MIPPHARRARLRPQVSQFEDCQVLLGVDDLDVFKGIELKLQAFERLLEEHPEWRGKVVLVQVRAAARAALMVQGRCACMQAPAHRYLCACQRTAAAVQTLGSPRAPC